MSMTAKCCCLRASTRRVSISMTRASVTRCRARPLAIGRLPLCRVAAMVNRIGRAVHPEPQPA